MPKLRLLSKLCFFCLVLSQTAHGVTADKSVVLTLESAKDYAVRNNFLVLEKTRSLDVMEANVSQAKSAYYPEIGVAGGINSENAATT